jgi:DNA polymerase V
MTEELKSYGLVSNNKTRIEIPLATESIAAGFPAPNGGYIDGNLDVNEFLISSPSSTYIYKVSGESMKDAGIMPGDFVLVDSSLEVNSGDTVVASIDGEFTIKEIKLGRRPMLIPRNKDYAPIEIGEGARVVIIGPVISVIRKYH